MVEDETTTALVHPGQTLEIDEAANLVVWLGQRVSAVQASLRPGTS